MTVGLVPYSARRVIQGVGRRLAELRVERGLTQEQVAETMDVTPQWLSRAENGENLTIATLVRFANIYEVAIPTLFEAPVSAARAKPGRPKRGAARKP